MPRRARVGRSLRHLAGVAALVCLAASCGEPQPVDVAGTSVAEGYSLELVATGFDRPTQLAATDDDRFVIGELAGAENDGTGRVLVFDLATPDDRTVLATDLDKPTGVALRAGELFVMESTQLTRRSLAPGAEPVIVADQLPNNGRSQGSLTVTSDGALLFNTSGRKRGAERVPGSATLFSLPADSLSPVEIATGFKHAYAHVDAPDGELFVVEMTDGTFDGERGVDELVVIEPGDDAGWPFCVDDNRPVAEFGGTAERCAAVPGSHAVFGAGATPTSVVVAPWSDDTLLVALWIPGTIVAVPVKPGPEPHAGEIIVEGLESPQSLLVDGDRVLVVDHDAGVIAALNRS